MKRTGRTRNYTWYVKPLDALTNEAFARELDVYVAESHDVRDEDQRSHNLYVTTWEKVKLFQDSKTQSHLKFEVFVREGGGKLRRYSFSFSKKKAGKVRPPKKTA